MNIDVKDGSKEKDFDNFKAITPSEAYGKNIQYFSAVDREPVAKPFDAAFFKPIKKKPGKLEKQRYGDEYQLEDDVLDGKNLQNVRMTN